MTEKRFINDGSEILDTWLGYMGEEEPTEREIKEKDYLLVGVAHSQRDAENICEKLNEQLREKIYELKGDNKNPKDKNCYNCKNRETYDEGEGYGFVSLCKKDCMNTDGYFDYEYHRFKKSCICPFWEESEDD